MSSTSSESVETKLILTNLAIAAQIHHFKPLIDGAFLQKFQEVKENTFKLNLGKRSILIGENALFLSKYSIPAAEKPSGFAASVNRRLAGQKILSLRQENFDRLVVFEFNDFNLIIEFLTVFNVIVTDRQMAISACLKNEESKSRIIRKNAAYSFPAARGKNPLHAGADECFAFVSTNDGSLHQALQAHLNIAPFLLDDLLLEARIDRSLPAKKAMKSQVDGFFSVMESRFKQLSDGKAHLIQSGKNLSLSSLPLTQNKFIDTGKTVNDFLDDYWISKWQVALAHPLNTARQEKLAKVEKTLREQHEALARLAREESESKSIALAIQTHFTELEIPFRAARELLKSKNKEEKRLLDFQKQFPDAVRLDLARKKIWVKI